MDGADTVEEIDSLPDRQAGDTCGIDKFGGRKLRIVVIGEVSEAVVCSTDTKDIGIRVRVRIDVLC